MWQEVLEKIIGWLVPFLLGTVAGGVTMWFAVIRHLRDGMQCLLRDYIINQNEKWVERKYCPIYAKQALSRAYKVYHALKGNDVGTALYEETMGLPERIED
ncbi:MAG: hypothetical protein IJZ54_08925 [Clostridia bacterium]|nr:hypothetical protein [Clostridia bacterium]